MEESTGAVVGRCLTPDNSEAHTAAVSERPEGATFAPSQDGGTDAGRVAPFTTHPLFGARPPIPYGIPATGCGHGPIVHEPTGERWCGPCLDDILCDGDDWDRLRAGLRWEDGRELCGRDWPSQCWQPVGWGNEAFALMAGFCAECGDESWRDAE